MALHVRPKYWLIAFMPICISITAIAWQKTGAGNANESQNRQDTLPSKNRHKITRVDKDTRDEKDLDKEMRKLDEALKNIDTKIDKIDWQKIQGEIQASMDKVNMEMKNHQVDMEQIQRQIDESVKSIDMDKIKKETALAMQHMKEDIDINKINEELKRAVKDAGKQIDR